MKRKWDKKNDALAATIYFSMPEIRRSLTLVRWKLARDYSIDATNLMISAAIRRDKKLQSLNRPKKKYEKKIKRPRNLLERKCRRTAQDELAVYRRSKQIISTYGWRKNSLERHQRRLDRQLRCAIRVLNIGLSKGVQIGPRPRGSRIV